MSLSSLGFHEKSSGEERVAILVGPNGSGKSTFLRSLAQSYRRTHNVAIVCNTAYDRFNGIRGIPRMSAGRSFSSPKAIIKNAIQRALESGDSRFYQISSILEYCGYEPRFGLRVEQDWRRDLYDPRQHEYDGEFGHAIEFLDARGGPDIFWVDARRSALEFSLGREYASILRRESQLRAFRIIRQIRVYLERRDGGLVELQDASSGELALISSLIFLIIDSTEDALILIDEPENSLHPRWQREYIDTILTALNYRTPSIVLATHAPLIVTGALAAHSESVRVFQTTRGAIKPLELGREVSATSSIEEILWRAFEVVTPASHFVSETLVDAVAQFESGDASKEDVMSLIDSMQAASFERNQGEFFEAVKGLVNEVEKFGDAPGAATDV